MNQSLRDKYALDAQNGDEYARQICENYGIEYDEEIPEISEEVMRIISPVQSIQPKNKRRGKEVSALKTHRIVAPDYYGRKRSY